LIRLMRWWWRSQNTIAWMVERFVHSPYSDRLFWPTRVHAAGAPFVPGHLKFPTIFSGGFMPRRKYLSDSLKGLPSWPGYQPRLPWPMRMRPRFSRKRLRFFVWPLSVRRLSTIHAIICRARRLETIMLTTLHSYKSLECHEAQLCTFQWFNDRCHDLNHSSYYRCSFIILAGAIYLRRSVQ
jgi:hypothetical protein